MGVFTFIMAEFTSTVAPTRLFQAFCMDNHNLLPKTLPEVVKNVEFVEGDSTIVGCIKRVNFPDGKYVKNRMEAIDSNNFYFKYTSIEGDALPDTLDNIVFENKLESFGAETRFKVVAHYHTKGDNVMTEENVSERKQTNKKIFKTVNDYLIDNPQLYA